MFIFMLLYLVGFGACLISLGLSDSYGTKYSYWRTFLIAAFWPISGPYILIRKNRRT